MTIDDDDVNSMDERVPNDVHPDDMQAYLRERYSRSTMSDHAVSVFAEKIADKREVQGRVPDDPRRVGTTGETGRGEQTLGEVTYDEDMGRWRDAETGQFTTGPE